MPRRKLSPSWRRRGRLFHIHARGYCRGLGEALLTPCQLGMASKISGSQRRRRSEAQREQLGVRHSKPAAFGMKWGSRHQAQTISAALYFEQSFDVYSHRRSVGLFLRPESLSVTCIKTGHRHQAAYRPIKTCNLIINYNCEACRCLPSTMREAYFTNKRSNWLLSAFCYILYSFSLMLYVASKAYMSSSWRR